MGVRERPFHRRPMRLALSLERLEGRRLLSTMAGDESVVGAAPGAVDSPDDSAGEVATTARATGVAASEAVDSPSPVAASPSVAETRSASAGPTAESGSPTGGAEGASTASRSAVTSPPTRPSVSTASGVPFATRVDDSNVADDLAGGGASDATSAAGSEGTIATADSSASAPATGDRIGMTSRDDSVASEGESSPASLAVGAAGRRAMASLAANPASGMPRDVRVSSLGPGSTPAADESDAQSLASPLGSGGSLPEDGLVPPGTVAKAGCDAPAESPGLPSGVGNAEAAVLGPTQAELLTDFLPVDRQSLETAIDSFLENLDDLGLGLPGLEQFEGIILPAAAGTIAFVSVRALSKRRKGKEEDAEDSERDRDLIRHPILGLLG